MAIARVIHVVGKLGGDGGGEGKRPRAQSWWWSPTGAALCSAGPLRRVRLSGRLHLRVDCVWGLWWELAARGTHDLTSAARHLAAGLANRPCGERQSRWTSWLRCDRAFKTHTAGAPDPGSAHEFSVLVPGAGMAKTKPGKERVEESKQEQAEDVQRKRQKLESSRALQEADLAVEGFQMSGTAKKKERRNEKKIKKAQKAQACTKPGWEEGHGSGESQRGACAFQGALACTSVCACAFQGAWACTCVCACACARQDRCWGSTWEVVGRHHSRVDTCRAAWGEVVARGAADAPSTCDASSRREGRALGGAARVRGQSSSRWEGPQVNRVGRVERHVGVRAREMPALRRAWPLRRAGRAKVWPARSG